MYMIAWTESQISASLSKGNKVDTMMATFVDARLGVGLILACGFGLLADDKIDERRSEKLVASIAKEILIKRIPEPAITSSKKHWNKQKEVVVRVDVERTSRFRFKLVPTKELRNDGHWYRLSASPIDPSQKLNLEIYNIATPEPGKTTFTAVLAGPMSFRVEQQLWKSGLRLFSGETRGRLDAQAMLDCEVSSRSDWQPNRLLPTQILKVKINSANIAYDNLKVEHTAGVGGEAAELLGEALIGVIKLLKPSLEEELIEKANSAIVKAADSKEVKLDLERLVLGTK